MAKVCLTSDHTTPVIVRKGMAEVCLKDMAEMCLTSDDTNSG